MAQATLEVETWQAVLTTELERHTVNRVRNRVRRHAAPLLGEQLPGVVSEPLCSSRGLAEEESDQEREGDGWDCLPGTTGTSFPFAGPLHPGLAMIDAAAAPTAGAVATASAEEPLTAASLMDAVRQSKR
jgi:hypothetical protein